VANGSGSTTCVNSTIAGNGGAGLAAAAGSLSTASCTIAANGGTGLDAGGDGEATAQNSVIAGNLQGCAGKVSSKGYNLTDDQRCGFSASGDLNSDAPRIGTLAANGGPTQTIALTGGSPAIDAGAPTAAPIRPAGMLTVDQRGPSPGRWTVRYRRLRDPTSGCRHGGQSYPGLGRRRSDYLYELKDFAAGDPRMKDALSTHQADVVDLLITKRLSEKEVEKQGIKVQDPDVDRYITNIKERNKINDEQLDAALAQQGLTRERYRVQVREELQRAQLINREIRGKVSVSPEDIERYQKEHPSEGTASGEPQIAISQIFLKIPSDATPEQVAAVEAHADQIYDALKGGADFAALAERDSEDGGGKSGGKLGTFKQGELRDDLAAAIAGLKVGEVSKPVRSSSGVHIVRVDERLGPGEEKGTADGKTDEIKEQLYAKALEDRYNRWLKEDLRQRHHVEIRP
jgi:peptidyl-prolyl cis-trans isomerase SurA